jgi:hypothetical protein
VFFTDRDDLKSLKIMDLSKGKFTSFDKLAFIIEKKDEFVKAVDLHNIETLNSLEKILLYNRDDEHTDSERSDNSYLVFKPPEFILKEE